MKKTNKKTPQINAYLCKWRSKMKEEEKVEKSRQKYYKLQGIQFDKKEIKLKNQHQQMI